VKGRKPKPAEVRRLEGNPGKRPIPETARIGRLQAPSLPAHLPVPARRVWRQLVPPMADAGLVREVDGPALEALCMSVAVMRGAAAHLKGDDWLVSGSHGNVKRTPYFDIWLASQAEVRKWAERFGLDPSTRTRLGLMAVRGRTLEHDLFEKLGDGPRRRLEVIDGG
jgi:P27 family predicted phage terminase small subunit